ncbi:unnamed protein product, partial [Ectocarpus sp. 13 AM-2016]
ALPPEARSVLPLPVPAAVDGGPTLPRRRSRRRRQGHLQAAGAVRGARQRAQDPAAEDGLRVQLRDGLRGSEGAPGQPGPAGQDRGRRVVHGVRLRGMAARRRGRERHGVRLRPLPAREPASEAHTRVRGSGVPATYRRHPDQAHCVLRALEPGKRRSACRELPQLRRGGGVRPHAHPPRQAGHAGPNPPSR